MVESRLVFIVSCIFLVAPLLSSLAIPIHGSSNSNTITSTATGKCLNKNTEETEFCNINKRYYKNVMKVLKSDRHFLQALHDYKGFKNLILRSTDLSNILARKTLLKLSLLKRNLVKSINENNIGRSDIIDLKHNDIFTLNDLHLLMKEAARDYNSESSPVARKIASNRDVYDIFNSFDVDENGYWDEFEQELFIGAEHYTTPEEEREEEEEFIRTIMETAADQDNDGTVDLEEFKTIFGFEAMKNFIVEQQLARIN